MADLIKCGKCRNKKNEGLVGCEGSCGKWFHFSCCNLSATEFSVVSKSKNLFFLCDICRNKCEIVEVGSLKVQNDRLSSINESINTVTKNIHARSVQDALQEFKEEVVKLVQTDIKDAILSKLGTSLTSS